MDGGPPRPDTEDMTAVGAAMAIADWSVTRKAFRDKQTRLLKKSTGSTVSSDKAKVSLGAKRASRQEVSSVALNSHKISYD
jgi:hypothetical protein